MILSGPYITTGSEIFHHKMVPVKAKGGGW